MAKAFSTMENGSDPQKTRPAGLAYPGGENPPEVTQRKLKQRPVSKLVGLCGNAVRSKKFVKALRRLLADLGVALVGPLPYALLERVWDRFGVELISPHGAACWCVLCKSSRVAHMPFLVDLADTLVTYLVKMPVRAVLGILLPAPLKTAKFVSNKLWQWLKVLFPGYTSSLVHSVRTYFDRFVEWVKGKVGFPDDELLEQ